MEDLLEYLQKMRTWEPELPYCQIVLTTYFFRCVQYQYRVEFSTNQSLKHLNNLKIVYSPHIPSQIKT